MDDIRRATANTVARCRSLHHHVHTSGPALPNPVTHHQASATLPGWHCPCPHANVCLVPPLSFMCFPVSPSLPTLSHGAPVPLWQPGQSHTLCLGETPSCLTTLPGSLIRPWPCVCGQTPKLPPAFCSRSLSLLDHCSLSSYSLVFQKVLSSEQFPGSFYHQNEPCDKYSVIPLLANRRPRPCLTQLTWAANNMFPFWTLKCQRGTERKHCWAWKLPWDITVFLTSTAVHMLFPSFLECPPVTGFSGKYSSSRIPPNFC